MTFTTNLHSSKTITKEAPRVLLANRNIDTAFEKTM